MQNKNIYIASDHAGFDLKTKLLKNFPKINDLGTKTDESVDYPDFAHKLTKEVLKNKRNMKCYAQKKIQQLVKDYILKIMMI